MKNSKIFNFLFIILTLIISSTEAFAIKDDGFSSPNEAANALFKPLKKGMSGVADSMKALPGEKDSDNPLIKEAKESKPERPLAGNISSILSKGGKLLYYRKKNEEVRLGGKMVKQFYELYFQNGGKRDAMIVIFQPTLSGGYHIMDVQIDQDEVNPRLKDRE